MICVGLSAQRQNRYFLKNNGDYVKEREQADYLRIVKEPEDGTALYVVNEYYLDGSNKSEGYSSKIDPPIYEGKFISYYANGHKKQLGTYQKGKFVDTVYHYFPNGRLYTAVFYATEQEKLPRYMTVKDSTGIELTRGGVGKYMVYSSDFKKLLEQGQMLNGLKEGMWKGRENAGKLTYEEIYVAGKLVSGRSEDEKGNVYTYTEVSVKPDFPEGMKEFYKYLSKNMRYPAELARQKINGTVMMKFTVNQDGSISNLVPTNNANPLFAQEAYRIISQSPAWVPGKIRGQLANVVFRMPISFNMR